MGMLFFVVSREARVGLVGLTRIVFNGALVFSNKCRNENDFDNVSSTVIHASTLRNEIHRERTKFSVDWQVYFNFRQRY